MIKNIMLLLTLLICTTAQAGEDPVDIIKRKITKAEETYAIELAKAQAETIKWLDGREATARKKGDKTTINTIKLQREKLETEGIIPKPCPVSVSRKIDTARDMLDATYVSLMKDALVAKLDDLADELETKHIDLLKEKPTFKLVVHMARNMVENGSFEWPEVPNNVDHLLFKNNGWSVTYGDVCRFKGAIPAHGNQLLQFGGELTQLVEGFTPGERYVVTAFVATYTSPKHPTSSVNFKVSIAGEEQSAQLSMAQTNLTHYLMPGNGAKWEQITLVFKALGESHELKIMTEDQKGVAVVDHVSITPYLGN